MPDPASKAVFLSHASQDAEAAKRICEALRAAGVEVWFDQSELVGGDAWDVKIRGKISSCALFVPIISANTQARQEGYFRLEWKLAEDRSHLMAKGTAFIVPVSVDATTERGALVPDGFLAVQWTKLPGGEASAAFVARAQKLLAGPGASLQARPAVSSQPGAVAPEARSGLPLWVGVALGAGLLTLGAFIVLRPAGQDAAAAPKPGAATKLAPPVLPAPTAAAPVAAAPVAAAKSIAVLPFENRSDEKGSEFFTDGIHDFILTSLANLGALQVVSRTSVMEYRGTKKKIPQIARELNVAYVLEGAVQRAGNTVLITGQLIRAATDEHVWAKNYPPRELTAANIFALQAELAQAIAGELKAVISPQEKNLLARRPTENLAALELYLKARTVKGRTLADFRNRELWLQTAVELDPAFALAWGELAVAHVETKAASMDLTPARLAKATAAIDRAIALAPESPEVIRAFGVYLHYGLEDGARAREQFEKLLRLQPNDAETLGRLGTLQYLQGRWPETIATHRTVTLLYPGNADYAGALAAIYWRVRRFDDAIAEGRRAIMLRPDRLEDAVDHARLLFCATGSTREMEELLARLEARTPQPTEVDWLRMELAWWRKDYAEYLRLNQTRPRSNPDLGGQRTSVSGPDQETREVAEVLCSLGDREGARARLGDLPARLRAKLELDPKNTQLLRALAIVEAILGNREEALRRITQAAEIVPEASDAFKGVSISEVRAAVYALNGDKDRAIAEIARLLRLPSNLNVHRLKVEPAFASFRGDPRWEALLDDPKNNAPLF